MAIFLLFILLLANNSLAQVSYHLWQPNNNKLQYLDIKDYPNDPLYKAMQRYDNKLYNTARQYNSINSYQRYLDNCRLCLNKQQIRNQQEQARQEQARQEQARQEQARQEQARQAKIPKSYPKPQYTNNSNGTVTDKRTSLMWMRCSLGQIWTGSTCSGSAKEYTWNNAKNLSTSFAGYDDWRTPSIVELNTLVYCSNGKQLKYKKQGYYTIKHEGSRGCSSNTRGGYQKPTINQTAFPNTPATGFWSSSPYADDSSDAWRLYFNDGDDKYNFRVNSYRVRLVRSGE